MWDSSYGQYIIREEGLHAGDMEVPLSVEIMPSALSELKTVHVFYRRQIAQAIREQLVHQPTMPTRNRKLLVDPRPSFECEPPLWELRVGSYRVFYDVDEVAQIVFVRAVREKPPHADTEDIL
jgi:mRNA-degrading endonuclease RelE of RelBE toxin-antitoxin system